MSVPARPHWQPQGPANRCVIDGHALGWSNCTPTATAMAVEKAWLSAIRPSGCEVRESITPRDVSGGTTLTQCKPFADAHGAPMSVYVGSKVVSPFYLAVQLQAGRGVVLQGNTGPLIATRFRSTGSGVNHAVYVNEVRGGKVGEPSEALVYDPAADGHRAGWGTAAQGPQWWPWNVAVAFARALHPYGESDPRTLKGMGITGVYSGVMPDTEPHAHLKYGAAKTSPFPDRVRVNVASAWTHSTPDVRVASRISPKLQRDDLFVAYQRVTKAGLLWLGSHDGNRWIRGDRVRNIGGTQ